MQKVLAVLVVGLLGSVSFADTAPDVGKMAEGDCAKARKAGKTCVLTIEDEDITGGVPTHTESSINIITFIKHNSLIRIRRDFIPEILKTAEDL